MFFWPFDCYVSYKFARYLYYVIDMNWDRPGWKNDFFCHAIISILNLRPNSDLTIGKNAWKKCYGPPPYGRPAYEKSKSNQNLYQPAL